jgi:carbonic anhydrase/acetyltransferase-like protein (isoleucine patch superfamily)
VIFVSDGKRPKIDESAYVAPAAVVSGDVTIGAGCAILHGAILTSEGAPIEIGESCVVMENAVLRAHSKTVKIGRRSIVSPHAYVVDTSLGEDAHVPAGTMLGENARARNPESYAKFLRDFHAADAAAGEAPRPKKAAMPPAPPPAEVEGVDSAMMQELAELEHRRQEALRKQREHK